MGHYRPKAQVSVTLNIELTDRWGGDCAINQVTRQAATSAQNFIQNRIPAVETNVRMVGKPKVQAIVWEEDD